MPILRLLKGSPYGPREIETMTQAYEAALCLCEINDRTSPTAELMARHVIGLFASGEDDPKKIAVEVSKEIKSLGITGPRAHPSGSPSAASEGSIH